MATIKKLAPMERAWRESDNIFSPLITKEQDAKLVDYYRHRRLNNKGEWVGGFQEYASKYIKIIEKYDDDEGLEGGNLIPFNLKRCQRILDMVVEELLKVYGYVRIMIPKCRQSGVSTYCQVRGHWKMRLWKGTDVRVISDSGQNVKKVFDMALMFYQYLPEEIRPPFTEKTKTLMVWGNKDEKTKYEHPGLLSRIEASTAGNPNTGRGSHHHVLLMTEIGMWQRSSEVLEAIEPALHDREPGTYGFMESTSAGSSGEFYERTMKMRDIASKGDNPQWHVVFLPAWLEEKYYKSVTDEEAVKIILTCDPYELGLLKKFRTLYTPRNPVKAQDVGKEYKPETVQDLVDNIPEGVGHVAWRREKLQTLGGNKASYDKNYAPTLEEFFAATGITLFDKRALLWYKEKTVRREGDVGRLVVPPKKDGVRQRPIFIRDPNGPLTIWEHPRPDRTYLGGCDAAVGKKADPEMTEHELALQAARDMADFCSLFMGNNRMEQVAEYNSNVIDAESFGDEVYNLGEYYGFAWIMVETGNQTAGYAVLKRLKELMYPALGRWEGRPDSVRTHYKTEAYGWEINGYTKPIMVADIQREVIRGAGLTYTQTTVDESRRPLLILRSLTLIHQLQNFAYLSSGGVGGRRSVHDDLVICLGLYLIMMAQQGGPTPTGVIQEIMEIVEDEYDDVGPDEWSI